MWFQLTGTKFNENVSVPDNLMRVVFLLPWASLTALLICASGTPRKFRKGGQKVTSENLGVPYLKQNT